MVNGAQFRRIFPEGTYPLVLGIYGEVRSLVERSLLKNFTHLNNFVCFSRDDGEICQAAAALCSLRANASARGRGERVTERTA
jgi:hypothetical protein